MRVESHAATGNEKADAITTISIPATVPLVTAGASSSAAGGDVCWIVYQTSFTPCPGLGSATLEAWRVSPPVKLRSYNFSLSTMRGLFPVSVNRVWIDYSTCPATGFISPTTTERLDYVGASFQSQQFDSKDDTRLVNP